MDIPSGTEEEIPGTFLLKSFLYSWTIFNFNFANNFNQITTSFRYVLIFLTVKSLRFSVNRK